MTARELLKNIKALRIAIDAKKAKIAALRAIAEKTTAEITGMPHNPSKEQSSMAVAVCKIIEQENACTELERQRKEAIDILCTMPDSEYTTLLIKRYVQEKSWERIALEMNYSVPHCYHLHAEAITKFDKMLNVIVNNTI